MTVTQLMELVERLGFSGLPAKPKKGPLVGTILSHWGELKSKMLKSSERLKPSHQLLWLQVQGAQAFRGECHRLESKEDDKTNPRSRALGRGKNDMSTIREQGNPKGQDQGGAQAGVGMHESGRVGVHRRSPE